MDINLVYLFIDSPVLGLLAYAFYENRKDLAAAVKEVFQVKYADDFGLTLAILGFVGSGIWLVTQGLAAGFDPVPAEILFAISFWVIVILAIYKHETGKKNSTPYYPVQQE